MRLNSARGGSRNFWKRGSRSYNYKIVERGGPKSLKMAFECSFQSFSYKSFANIPPKDEERGGGGGGGGGAGALPLNPLLSSITQAGLPSPQFLRSFRMDPFGFGSWSKTSCNKLVPRNPTTQCQNYTRCTSNFNSRSSDIQQQQTPVKNRRLAYILDSDDEKNIKYTFEEHWTANSVQFAVE